MIWLSLAVVVALIVAAALGVAAAQTDAVIATKIDPHPNGYRLRWTEAGWTTEKEQ